MCGPFLPAMALMLAGSAASFVGNRQAQRAQSRAFQSERGRQQGYSQEQQGHFEDSLRRAGEMATPENQTAAADRREASLASVIAPANAGAYLPGSSSADPVVRSAGERADAGQRGESAQLADALARVGGFGDQMLDTNIGNARNAGRIGQVGSFMRGSAGAGDAEVRAAANKGSTMRGLGQLAQMFGQAMMPGAGGAGKAVGGVAPTNGGRLAELFNPQRGGSLSWAFGG